MDKFDILEAMSGIRDEYIEDAAAFPNQAVQSEEQNVPLENKRGKDPKRPKILRLQRWAATAAALLCVCMIAFTIRSSQSERAADSDLKDAGMLSMAKEEVIVEDEIAENEISTEDAERVVTGGGSSAFDDGGVSMASEASGSAAPDSLVSSDTGPAETEMYVDQPEGEDVSPAAAMANAGVSGQVRQMTEETVRVFENSLAEETGYSSLRFTHEITTDSADWFSLKMKAYTCAADGFEQVTHFNINLDSSEYVTLDTLFSEDTDYITTLSNEVIRQMRERMASDPDAEFWLDSEEGSDYDFTEISPAQDFYFDSDGNLVLCFNEGEAAPLYMGEVEFTIPREITDRLLKDSDKTE